MYKQLELARIIGEPSNPSQSYVSLVDQVVPVEDLDNLKYHIRKAIKRVNEKNCSRNSS